MAYKPGGGKAAKKKEPEKPAEPQVEPPHLCDICGQPSVIKHTDGHRYCYTHEQIRLQVASHEQAVQRSKDENDTPRGILK